MSKWHAAVAAARRSANGFAPDPRPRPSTIVAHLVTVDERPCHDGVIRYDYRCSCGNALGIRDTDADARDAAKVHAPTEVRFAGRARFPFQIVATKER